MGQSPVSRFGLGSYFGNTLVRNEGMAGLGIANPSIDHVNLLNPALLPFNRNANLEVDLWYISRQIKIGSSYYSYGGAGPAQLSVCLPVHKRISAAFGIRRFTNYEFSYTRQDRIGGDSIRTQNSGTGGTTQAFLSFGYSLGKKLKIGLETGYVFGALESTSTFVILPSEVNFKSINIDKRKVSGLTFKPGLYFQTKMPGFEKVNLAIGAVGDLSGKIGYKKFSTTQIDLIPGSLDTLENERKFQVQQPATFTLAAGVYKTLEWSLSAEASYAAGNEVTYTESTVKGINSFSYKLGGEYSAGTEKSTRYLNIITWRAGLSYQTLPFTLNGENVRDKKVTIGTSFPIVRKETKFTRPLINLALSYGQRGLKNSYLGLEQYIQVTVGFTLNDTQWFTRYRVD